MGKTITILQINYPPIKINKNFGKFKGWKIFSINGSHRQYLFILKKFMSIQNWKNSTMHTGISFTYINPLLVSLFHLLHLSLCCCSVTLSYLTLWDPMDYSMPDFPVLHYLPELAQIHVHWVGDAIQPSHPLLPPSPFTFNFSQHQSLFQRASSLHQVAKVFEFQPQYQSFQWIFRVNFL